MAGKKFETGSTDFNTLWTHLENLPIPIGPDVSKDEFTPLAEFTSAIRSSDGGSSRKSVDLQIQSSANRELVGIVGEMRAFFYLHNKFGSDFVTRDAWVSVNRLNVFPEVSDVPNTTDDSLGFDFRFSHDGIHWRVEVKSTVGDDPQFELGISEIKAATRLSAEVQRTRWRILRIRNTLSDQPEFDWLPNPFQEQYKGLFRMHKGGMRVSYNRK